MKKRYTEEQIIGFLKQAEAEISVKGVCRKRVFSDGSLYPWRAKFGGMTVPDAKRLKELEAENAELKRPYQLTRRPDSMGWQGNGIHAQARR